MFFLYCEFFQCQYLAHAFFCMKSQEMITQIQKLTACCRANINIKNLLYLINHHKINSNNTCINYNVSNTVFAAFQCTSTEWFPLVISVTEWLTIKLGALKFPHICRILRTILQRWSQIKQWSTEHKSGDAQVIT